MVQKLRIFLKNKISPEVYEAVRRTYRRVAWSIYLEDNLTALANIYNTDKWGRHRYTPHYEHHFKKLRKKKLKILEIGVGGFDDPNAGGASLRMWKYYFPKSSIYSIDIYDKSNIQENRIAIFRGSQNDPEFLRNVVDQMEGLDIVIDDGSHLNEHVITSFRTLFPLLADGGIYVIEDTQTSYWPKFGGDSYDLNNPHTIMTFLKTLTDGLNYEEIARKGYQPSYLDQNIVSLHFYHNLVFIYKGGNREGSDYVHENIY
jgi:Rhamnosyl O-methyltransferase/CmcI